MYWYLCHIGKANVGHDCLSISTVYWYLYHKGKGACFLGVLCFGGVFLNLYLLSMHETEQVSLVFSVLGEFLLIC